MTSRDVLRRLVAPLLVPGPGRVGVPAPVRTRLPDAAALTPESRGQGGRQGRLNKNAVDPGICIQGIDLLEQGGEGGGFRENQGSAGNADFPGALFLAGNVSPRSRIFAHPDKNQARGDAAGFEFIDPDQVLPVEPGGKNFSIQNAGGHGGLKCRSPSKRESAELQGKRGTGWPGGGCWMIISGRRRERVWRNHSWASGSP